MPAIVAQTGSDPQNGHSPFGLTSTLPSMAEPYRAYTPLATGTVTFLRLGSVPLGSAGEQAHASRPRVSAARSRPRRALAGRQGRKHAPTPCHATVSIGKAAGARAVSADARCKWVCRIPRRATIRPLASMRRQLLRACCTRNGHACRKGSGVRRGRGATSSARDEQDRGKSRRGTFFCRSKRARSRQ